ncbi:transcription factor IIA, alpha/beta subunit-domain-containing protein [Rhodotorula diobovata]|uniref:Transcription factor IIA, alpha/beta subunit-domain-containing protein n=1 Tax=Rhodotorula diobovata TaxID=5288 RepID=A0A5C5FNP3_9BASI|nr:transcription factor IIA, alpha/beta subunit-domain-containing protein [Rhodotorula diobovata]
MSNKQVPAVYRGVITDVIDNIRPEFDQLGVEEAVLQELLRLWELRLAQSRAADFTQDQRMAPVARQFPVLKHDDRPAQPDEKPDKKDIKGDVKPKTEGGASADDDAINSDLDDDEDEDDEDDVDGADPGGDLVIALYEKVQRVKNKWKVTLKDGLVSVNGREYLFAKCQGEFEW